MTSGPHAPSISTLSQTRLRPTLPTTELPVTFPALPGQPGQSSGTQMADAGTVRTDGTGTAPTSEAEPISPPSGPISDRALCCPDVATFEGSTGGWQTYFGFDDKTNSVENKGQDEYWSPPDKGKTLPSDKETRDGARWVSVAVGHEAQVEVNFGGNFTNGCLNNCSYVVEPATIAEVTSPQPTHSGAALKIKGLAEGEASLKVMCNGEVKGYFHIWCAFIARVDLEILTIVSRRARDAIYSVEALKEELNKTFRQALIEFNILDKGKISMPQTEPEWLKLEYSCYMDDLFLPLEENAIKIKKYVDKTMEFYPPEFQLSPSAIKLYFYVHETETADVIPGQTLGIGNPDIFMYIDNDYDTLEGIVAHEVGHALGLVHSNDTFLESRRRQQFPNHHLDSVGMPTYNIPKTNTEPAVEGGLIAKRTALEGPVNIMAADPLNRMGYWPAFNQARFLRYRQWKACKRIIK